MEVYATTNMDFTVICIQNIELWPYEIKLCFTFCHLSWVSWVIFLVPEVKRCIRIGYVQATRLTHKVNISNRHADVHPQGCTHQTDGCTNTKPAEIHKLRCSNWVEWTWWTTGMSRTLKHAYAGCFKLASHQTQQVYHASLGLWEASVKFSLYITATLVPWKVPIPN